MKNLTIKVQIDSGASVSSILQSDMTDSTLCQPLTFLAFSDEMKARVLENFLKSPAKIGLSLCEELPKTGEWHEKFAPNCVFNRAN